MADTSWEAAVLWLKSQPSLRELVVDGYYDDPLSDAADRYWHSAEWAAVRQFFPTARGRALDVGAGRGIASYALSKDGFRVFALEPDPSHIVGAEAIRRLSDEASLGITVVGEKSERLPFDDSSFDFIFVRAALHHAADLRAACAEFRRVLKTGGILLCVREHVISRKADLAAFLDAHPLHRHYGGENAYLLSEYEAAFREAGLRVLKVLAPFDSALNYAPRSAGELRDEVARRIGRFAIIASLLRSLLAVPAVWFLVRKLAGTLDRRAGRLYSFVVTKQ